MGQLTGNPIIECAFVAWFLAQLIKVMLDLVVNRRVDASLLVTSGGMPSSHSALVMACATAIFETQGIESPLFALSLILAAVVMYDACNVRRSAGDTARLVNQLLEHVEKLTAENFADDLKIIMGHTPLQVLMGALLGIAIGLLA